MKNVYKMRVIFKLYSIFAVSKLNRCSNFVIA